MIDAHHHFWDPAGAHYPWMTERNAAIHKAYRPDDLRPSLVEAGVHGTVLVQTRAALEETRELLSIAESTEFVVGVVGWVDLTAPNVDELLAEMTGSAGGRWLVGVRHQVHDEPDASWLMRPDVQHGIQAAGHAGLSYDLLVRARELPAALETVRSLEDVRFVVDHLAKPPIAEQRLEPWQTLLRELARSPNVFCKLSGMVTEADWRTWRVDHLRPFVQRALEWFGPERCLFGSDWPVCLLAATYTQVVDALEGALEGINADERAYVFGGSALEVYGLHDTVRSVTPV